MPLKCTLKFDSIAVVGCQETGAHEQQDYICLFQLLVNLSINNRSGDKSAVVPRLDKPLMLEGREMLLQLVSVLLVIM